MNDYVRDNLPLLPEDHVFQISCSSDRVFHLHIKKIEKRNWTQRIEFGRRYTHSVVSVELEYSILSSIAGHTADEYVVTKARQLVQKLQRQVYADSYIGTY